MSANGKHAALGRWLGVHMVLPTVLATLTSLPATADSRLAEAEALARRKEPAAAIDLYRAARKDGLDGAALRYNLGTLLLEEGRVGEAVLHLRAAQRRAPRDPDIRHNLGVALEARTDRLAGDPILHPLDALGSTVPPRAARWLFGVPLALLGLVVGGLAFAEGRARTVARGLAAACTIASVGGATLWLARRSAEAAREVVLLSESASALKEPGLDAAEAFAAHAGLYGEVVDEVAEGGGFVRVRFENGLEAWLANKDVGFVD